MNIFAKLIVGSALIAGIAALPPHPAASAAPSKGQPVKVAEIAPVQTKTVAAQPVTDQDCFVARMKSSKRKAASHMRLVKVCE